MARCGEGGVEAGRAEGILEGFLALLPKIISGEFFGTGGV